MDNDFTKKFGSIVWMEGNGNHVIYSKKWVFKHG